MSADIQQLNFTDALHVLEEFRREKRTLDQNPMPGVTDYSDGITALKVSVAALSESIENGQAKRSSVALVIALSALEVVSDWMEAKGYDLDEAASRLSIEFYNDGDDREGGQRVEH